MTALPPEKKITKADIEAKANEVKGVVDAEVANVRGTAIGIGVGVVVLLVIVTFLLGRRRGRRLSTIVEIRRMSLLGNLAGFAGGQARKRGGVTVYLAMASTGFRVLRRIVSTKQRTLLRFEVKPGEVYESSGGVRRGR